MYNCHSNNIKSNVQAKLVSFIKHNLIWGRGSVTVLHEEVSGLIPDGLEMFNFPLGLEIGKVVGKVLNRYFYFRIYLGLIPNASTVNGVGIVDSDL